MSADKILNGPFADAQREHISALVSGSYQGILYLAQGDHCRVSRRRIVVLEKMKVHPVENHVDDARAAPFAAAKNTPKLILFDGLHGRLSDQER
jgi:hypothetical protein